MILKLIKSSFVPYCLLIFLGSSYLLIDRYFDNCDLEKDAFLSAINLYAIHLDEQIIILEKGIFDGRLGGSRKKGFYDNYIKVSKFYYDIQSNSTISKYQRLKDVIRVSESYGWSLNKDKETGIDELDSRLFYISFLHKFIFSGLGCGTVNRNIPLVTFDPESRMYVIKLVERTDPKRFVMIYKKRGYQITGNLVNVKFDKEDIDKGYAEVIIRDRISNDEKSHRIEIPSYAFKV